MEDTKRFSILEYTNYIIIVVACLIAAVVPPFLGTVTGIGLCFPTTTAGWIVWGILQLCNCTANCLLLYAFTSQGKDDAKTHPSYKKAIELLRLNKISKETLLMSPQEWEHKVWRKKAIWMFIGTLVGGIALTQAVLSFDALRFIVQLITLTFGIVFGLFQMKATKEMYTDHYLEYAEQQVRIKKEEELAATTTNYLEITTTSTVERTRQIPLTEENSNVQTQ